MHTEPHMKSEIANNKGSCKKYAHYLTKYNTHFFSASRVDISLEEATQMIDKHIGSGVGKNDDKWFAPSYNLSEEEAQFLAFSFFGKHYTDYSELSEKEREIWNEKLIEIARAMQDVMAQNFNRQEMGIKNGHDLMYVGVVENQRTYKGTDEEVKKGRQKVVSGKKALTRIFISFKVEEPIMNGKVKSARWQMKGECERIIWAKKWGLIEAHSKRLVMKNLIFLQDIKEK